jgi:hypothetical protein
VCAPSLSQKSTHGAKDLKKQFDYHLAVLNFNEALEDAKSLNCPKVNVLMIDISSQ